MNIHYIDHGTPSDDVVRIVQARARQLDALLARRPEHPVSVDVTLSYDIRPDTYVASLDLHIGDRVITASGCADLKWAALHHAFEALLTALRCDNNALGSVQPRAERDGAELRSLVQTDRERHSERRWTGS